MSRSAVLLLLACILLVGSTLAATHVNISIGHQPITNPADVTYVDGHAPAELRAGPVSGSNHQSDFGFRGDGGSHASARLVAGNDRSRADSSSRQSFEQHKQNQEFERYIQNYHSGPTVETVFESSTPSSSQRQHKTSSSSSTSSSFGGSSSNGASSQRLVAIGSRPSQVHTFERQVALPTAAPTGALLPPSDDRQTHTIVNHQPVSSSGNGETVSLSSSASSSSGGGFDQSGFDQSSTGYNKHSFGYDDGDVSNQFPPSVDESQNSFSYGGSSGSNFYSGNDQSHSFGGSTPAPGYLPSYPRPVVTKTIQIAQPALKAKKFEIRHPAIQKEFYDIEERVVIKPAGTIVVELERPVAKIPKGETILPLGHPHPAVASAYNTNGPTVVQTMGSDVVSSSAGTNQYSPSPVYTPKSVDSQNSHHPAIGGTTIASAVTTTPSYDISAKDEFVESNLNKQFNADAQYVTTTERSYADDKQSSGEGFFVTTTESNRNFAPQFYNRDETDRRFSGHVGHVEVKNNGAPGVNTAFVSNKNQNHYSGGGQSTYGAVSGSSAGSSQYQPNYNDHNNNNNNQFKGEFFSGDFYNHQQSAKPARLQEEPRPQSSTTHVIKHEHNIHLPASQHNIYLGRVAKDGQEQSAQVKSSSRYNDEAARVLEVKPYLQHRPGAVIVYAPTTMRPPLAVSNDRYNYNQQQDSYDGGPRYAQPQGHRHREAAIRTVQYSAPYSSMRRHPDQSARYVYGGESSYKSNANLVAESSSSGSADNVETFGQTQSRPQAHIHIQIPHHPQEADKPIVVSSTISPVVHKAHEARTGAYRQSSQSAAYYRDNDADRFSSLDGYQGGQQEYGFERSAKLEQPDCDHTTNNDHHQNANYQQQQKSLRVIESPVDGGSGSGVGGVSSSGVDVSLKSTNGHVATPGSRVIAATAAPTDASAASESFHKRRIVVNHPFQTVREVVEHEPITNYHHVQVNEPASPEFYQHTAPYYQQHETHGALRHVDAVPLLYHHHSATTHGNLHYAPALPVVHGVAVGYHHHG